MFYLYCLTLDRRQQQEQALSSLGLRPDQIRWQPGFRDPKRTRQYNIQVAHLQLWARLTKELGEDDYALIIEDDVHFAPDCLTHLAKAHEVMSKERPNFRPYDIILAGYQGELLNSQRLGPMIRLGSMPLIRPHTCHGLFGYLVTRQGVKNLIKSYLEIVTSYPSLRERHLDWILRVLYGRKLQAFALTNPVVFHND